MIESASPIRPEERQSLHGRMSASSLGLGCLIVKNGEHDSRLLLATTDTAVTVQHGFLSFLTDIVPEP